MSLFGTKLCDKIKKKRLARVCGERARKGVFSEGMHTIVYGRIRSYTIVVFRTVIMIMIMIMTMIMFM